MYTHRSKDYDCPFCRIVDGKDVQGNGSKQSDVFYQNDHVTAFICSRWWPNNYGHALVVPNHHWENIYSIPLEIGGYIHEATRQISIAFKKVYRCEGVSTRQHNEPSGYQDVFHYHMHVFPRYTNDYLYDLTYQYKDTTAEERKPYAEKLRTYFETI